MLLLEHPVTAEQREYDGRPTTIPAKLIGVGEAPDVRECARENYRRPGVLPHSVHSQRVGTEHRVDDDDDVRSEKVAGPQSRIPAHLDLGLPIATAEEDVGAEYEAAPKHASASSTCDDGIAVDPVDSDEPVVPPDQAEIEEDPAELVEGVDKIGRSSSFRAECR